jgi:hypothetical protein
MTDYTINPTENPQNSPACRGGKSGVEDFPNLGYTE